ncbi:hypothetical protein [Embleya sp. NBC_00896]|uniref:hypothetical protein n=1 Tax=Embleya sp. NBC_00896 TaxID=2975961 RepID=UPI003863601D|nr:hypothetical protein OG928_27725 [Embleya sp. NBC_00896]
MSVFSTRSLAAVAIAGALGLGLTACDSGSDDDKKAGSTTPSQQQPAARQSEQSPTTPGGSAGTGGAARNVELKAGKDATLGTIVSDGTGFTLYRFDKDTAKPSKSNCDGECAVKWPAVTTTDGNVQLNGIDKSAVGSVKRSDGTTQVTIGGWPVYRFAADAKPGETKGQGVGGVWFAVTPDGKKAGAATTPAPETGKPATGSGGYSY